MSRVRRTAALAAFVSLPATALAFEHLVRDPDGGGGNPPLPIRWQYSTPIEYRQNEADAPANVDVPALVDAAYQTWEDVPSSSIAFARGADTTSFGFDFGDDLNVVSYDDPDGDLETGILAAAVAWVVSSTPHGYDGDNYYTVEQGDIVFNDGTSLTDTEGASLLGGCITGEWDAEAIALHEIGHLFGLDHNNTSYAGAIMYEAISECDATRADPKADDIDGVTFLYDSGVAAVYPSFTYDEDRGYTPLEVAFTDASTGNVTSRSWNFGDGGTSTATNPTHQYTAAGIYDVRLVVNGGPSVEAVNAIEVITRPEPEFSADVIEGDAPLTVEFENETQNAGADPEYRWFFGDGDAAQSENPTHTYEEAGVYTVRLRVDAGAGYIDEEKDAYITVFGEEKKEDELLPGCGCRLTAAPATRARGTWLLGGAFAILLLARRRTA